MPKSGNLKPANSGNLFSALTVGLELLRLGLRRYEEKKNPRCTTTYVEREVLDNNGNIKVLRTVTRTVREN